MDFGLSGYLGVTLYAAAIVALLLTVFWRPWVGFYFLLPLILLQSLRYRLNTFPLGKSVIGIMLVGIALGLLRQKQKILVGSPFKFLVGTYVVYTFASLWMGSAISGYALPLPGDSRFGVWQDYILMPVLLFLTTALDLDLKKMRIAIFLMCVSTLALDRSYWDIVSGRDYTNYTEDLRNSADQNAMGYAGSNGMAAFEAQCSTFLLALAAFERRRLIKLGYWGLAIFSASCLAFSLSRGGYLAILAGWLFIGFMKNRVLLVFLVAFLFTWTWWVPKAVNERVSMTYDQQDNQLDSSSQTRISIWEDALQLFNESPIIGMGFNTYQCLHRIRGYEDTHNLYVKILVETGIVGLLLFVAMLWRFVTIGFRLFRSNDPFFASLGLGLAGWIVAALVANVVGDRWMYMQVCGYMWIIAGFVAKAWILERQHERALEPALGVVQPA